MRAQAGIGTMSNKADKIKVKDGRGRPKGGETVSIHVRTPKDLADTLEEYRKLKGFRSKQEAINFLLQSNFEKNKKNI